MKKGSWRFSKKVFLATWLFSAFAHADYTEQNDLRIVGPLGMFISTGSYSVHLQDGLMRSEYTVGVSLTISSGTTPGVMPSKSGVTQVDYKKGVMRTLNPTESTYSELPVNDQAKSRQLIEEAFSKLRKAEKAPIFSPREFSTTVTREKNHGQFQDFKTDFYHWVADWKGAAPSEEQKMKDPAYQLVIDIETVPVKGIFAIREKESDRLKALSAQSSVPRDSQDVFALFEQFGDLIMEKKLLKEIVTKVSNDWKRIKGHPVAMSGVLYITAATQPGPAANTFALFSAESRVVSVSSATIDASLFQVPSGYRQVEYSLESPANVQKTEKAAAQ